MNKRLKCMTGAIAALLTLASVTGASAATGTTCQAAITGTSGVQQALTGATDGVTQRQIKQSYAKAFAAGRRDAIAAWSARASKACPGHSPRWFRASSKNVTVCDQAMGGRFSVCASAIPGRTLRGR